MRSATRSGQRAAGSRYSWKPFQAIGDVGGVGVGASEHAEVAADLGEVPPEAVQVDGGRDGVTPVRLR